MMDLLAWIEQTPVSAFVREDFYAYFVLLIFHALGMAFLVGGGMAIGLRVLGVAGNSRMERFRAFVPWMWAGAAMAVASGLGLLAGYPAKALTNWVFPLKLALLACAATLVWLIVRDVFPAAEHDDPLPRNSRLLAGGSIVLWLAGVACGKLLLYTNTMLLTTD